MSTINPANGLHELSQTSGVRGYTIHHLACGVVIAARIDPDIYRQDYADGHGSTVAVAAESLLRRLPDLRRDCGRGTKREVVA